jgi:hypothetical protein
MPRNALRRLVIAEAPRRAGAGLQPHRARSSSCGSMCSRRSATGSTRRRPSRAIRRASGRATRRARESPRPPTRAGLRSGRSRNARSPGRAAFVGLDHGVGRALDAALHAQRAQQVAHEGGLAGAQRAVQFDEGVAQRGQRAGLAAKAAQAASSGQWTMRVPRIGACTRSGRHHIDGQRLDAAAAEWAHEAGFSQIGVADVDLASAEPGLLAGCRRASTVRMGYMAAHGLKRARPAELVPGTVSVITARMDYLPRDTPDDWAPRELAASMRRAMPCLALRPRAGLSQGAAHAAAAAGRPAGGRDRAFRAPRVHRLGAGAGGGAGGAQRLGWRGKHTLALQREAGSMFFLGEIYVDLALPTSEPVSSHCGQCTACLDACPTRRSSRRTGSTRGAASRT